jgi:hypothetical protein
MAVLGEHVPVAANTCNSRTVGCGVFYVVHTEANPQYWQEVRLLVLPRTSCLIILPYKAVRYCCYSKIGMQTRTVEVKWISYNCLNEWLMRMWVWIPLIRSQVLLQWLASNIVSSLQHLALLSVCSYFLLTVFHAILPEEKCLILIIKNAYCGGFCNLSRGNLQFIWQSCWKKATESEIM